MLVFFIVLALNGDGENRRDTDLTVHSGQAHRPTVPRDVLVPSASSAAEGPAAASTVGQATTAQQRPVTMDEMDLEFQEIVDGAISRFSAAKGERLDSHQDQISSDLSAAMTGVRKNIQELFGTAGGEGAGPSEAEGVSVDADEVELMGNLVEAELRGLVEADIDGQCREMLDEKAVDMEAAVDINQESEAEGEGDPIDLREEEADLVEEVRDAVDDIVDAVLQEVPALALKVVAERILLTLNGKYAGTTFSVDVDDATKKVTGWHVAAGSAPVLEATEGSGEETATNEDEATPADDEPPIVETNEEEAVEDDGTDAEATKEGDVPATKEEDATDAKGDDNAQDRATDEDKVRDEQVKEPQAIDIDDEDETAIATAGEEIVDEGTKEENDDQ